MYLILGLGNIGPKYELTRHNIGFTVVDTLVGKHGIILDSEGHFCQYGSGNIDNNQVMIGKPMTYMNKSGLAAKALTTALNISPHQVIVVYDEIDLRLGKIKVRHKGGDAGNRGVRSIIYSLGTEKFTRVRVGVGRPEDSESISDYVLSPFLEDEWPLVNETVENAVERIETTLNELKHKKTQPEEEIE